MVRIFQHVRVILVFRLVLIMTLTEETYIILVTNTLVVDVADNATSTTRGHTDGEETR
jgi:hypothetical protein